MRRSQTLFLACALAVAVAAPAATQSDNTVAFASFGGELNNALIQAWFKPVSEKLGAQYRANTMNGIADIRLQVNSRNVTWDLVNPGGSECVQAAKEGLFEPLDYGVINAGGSANGIDPKLRTPHWIADQYYSLVMVWNTEKFGSNPPKSWADFWDTAKHPGKRGVYWRAAYTFETALLADGVPLDKLYPLDIDRALKKLAALKPHIAVYWKSGGQTIQLMKDKEVDLIMTWNGRADAMVKAGLKVDYTFNQGILDHSCFAIPKGAKNKALAMRFLKEIASPEMMVGLPKYIAYGPANVDAYKLSAITPEMAKVLPSSPQNLGKQALIDAAYWLEHREAVEKRWEALKTQ